MSETHKIGIIADTHDLLRPEVLEHLEGCEAILHAGDISHARILKELAHTAPVYAVLGNNDREPAFDLPTVRWIGLFGIRICMAHMKKDLPQDLSEADLVIYGHSHRCEEIRRGKTVFLNPGSCGPRRFLQPITMAVLTVSECGFEIGKIEIPHRKAAETMDIQDEKLLREDPVKLVESVVAELSRGKTVAQAARKLHISEELAETIDRMYLTHPGVTIEGILRKMGR